MQQQKQPKQKQHPKLKQIRYRKLNLSNGNTIITYNSVHKVQPKGVLIQFPLIDPTQCQREREREREREESEYCPPVLDLKQYQEEIYKKSNFRAVKALMKTYEENRRRNSQDCMNLIGLDIKKINYLPPARSRDKLEKRSTNKLQQYAPRKLSPQSRNLSSRSEKTRKISQQSETLGKGSEESTKILKLEMTQSAFLYRKKAQQISHSPSPSPSKSKPKPKYLYEKLAGTNYIYDKRIKTYTDLLFKLQYAHNIYINLDLKPQQLNNRSRRLKYYVGPGNNCAMIKGLLKRRFWWVQGEAGDREGCAFLWTQVKCNGVFDRQRRAGKVECVYRGEQYEEDQEEKEKDGKKISPHKRDQQKALALKSASQSFNSKILNPDDCQSYKKYLHKHQLTKQHTYTYRQQKTPKILTPVPQPPSQQPTQIHNHLQHNYFLGNKKALFYNLKQYYQLLKQNVFEYIPLTFHIRKGLKDPEYKRFLEYYGRRAAQIKREEKREEDGEDGDGQGRRKMRNIWIVKPGENSNQGRGITVIDEIYELNNIIKRIGQKKPNQSPSKTLSQTPSSSKTLPQPQTQPLPQPDHSSQTHTYIVQMYIDRPLLYNNRKFDIRHYMMISNIFGITRAYWYAQGYIRTSSYQFNIGIFEEEIHLTNDAVQKRYPDYGKYEPYNKVSYEEFQRYLDTAFPGKKYDFKKQILPQMKKMGTDAARSVYTKISPKNQMHNFEIFGLDFMIDKNFRPWLIEINTNPCLDCACPLLDRIIPYMVEQSFKLTLDLVYPPPAHYPNTCKHFAPMVNLEQFKYELIFDSQTEGEILKGLYRKVKGNLMAQIGEIQEDEQFKDDGKEIKLDDFT